MHKPSNEQTNTLKRTLSNHLESRARAAIAPPSLSGHSTVREAVKEMDSRGSTLKGSLEFNKKVQFILLISNFDSSTLYGDFTKNITKNATTFRTHF